MKYKASFFAIGTLYLATALFAYNMNSVKITVVKGKHTGESFLDAVPQLTSRAMLIPTPPDREIQDKKLIINPDMQNTAATDALRKFEKDREKQRVLSQVHEESIEESVAKLKTTRFHKLFTPAVAYAIRHYTSSNILRNRQIANDPRISKLLAIAEEGTPEERERLLVAIHDELAHDGLGEEARRAAGDTVDINLLAITGLPFVVAALDRHGEQLELLAEIARLYVSTEYRIASGEPLLDGSGIGTYFSAVLAEAMETVLTNLGQDEKKREASDTLAEYLSGIERLDNDIRARLSLVGFLFMKSLEVETQSRLFPLLEVASFIQEPLPHPVSSYLPKWFVPGNHYWMVIAAGIRVNAEINGEAGETGHVPGTESLSRKATP